MKLNCKVQATLPEWVREYTDDYCQLVVNSIENGRCEGEAIITTNQHLSSIIRENLNLEIIGLEVDENG